MADNMPSSLLGNNYFSDIHDWHLYLEQILRAVIVNDSVDSLYLILGVEHGPNI